MTAVAILLFFGCLTQFLYIQGLKRKLNEVIDIAEQIAIHAMLKDVESKCKNTKS